MFWKTSRVVLDVSNFFYIFVSHFKQGNNIILVLLDWTEVSSPTTHFATWRVLICLHVHSAETVSYPCLFLLLFLESVPILLYPFEVRRTPWLFKILAQVHSDSIFIQYTHLTSRAILLVLSEHIITTCNYACSVCFLTTGDCWDGVWQGTIYYYPWISVPTWNNQFRFCHFIGKVPCTLTVCSVGNIHCIHEHVSKLLSVVSNKTLEAKRYDHRNVLCQNKLWKYTYAMRTNAFEREAWLSDFFFIGLLGVSSSFLSQKHPY